MLSPDSNLSLQQVTNPFTASRYRNWLHVKKTSHLLQALRARSAYFILSLYIRQVWIGKNYFPLYWKKLLSSSIPSVSWLTSSMKTQPAFNSSNYSEASPALKCKAKQHTFLRKDELLDGVPHQCK